ncbi:MAG: GAF domain-containing protein, partial [Sphaerotilus sp.]|nr:GAF domain-containing protein [Sphaerotilus sp.]
MFVVPSAAQELSHLQTLRSLASLDTAHDSTLDDLVRVAAHAFRCPIALISLVGADRQWFKASFGPVPPHGSTSLPLCAQALQYNEVFVVSDASLEPQYADLPLVKGPMGVRFYAGVSLRVDGHKVGTLCVLDHK